VNGIQDKEGTSRALAPTNLQASRLGSGQNLTSSLSTDLMLELEADTKLKGTDEHWHRLQLIVNLLLSSLENKVCGSKRICNKVINVHCQWHFELQASSFKFDLFDTTDHTNPSHTGVAKLYCYYTGGSTSTRRSSESPYILSIIYDEDFEILSRENFRLGLDSNSETALAGR
jgi:hypothetical protein